MSHRVTALYHDREKARLAAGDLQLSGVDATNIVLADGLTTGSGRLEVKVRDMDQAIDVRTFLQDDGAHSVEIRGEGDEPVQDTMPTVPAQ